MAYLLTFLRVKLLMVMPNMRSLECPISLGAELPAYGNWDTTRKVAFMHVHAILSAVKQHGGVSSMNTGEAQGS